MILSRKDGGVEMNDCSIIEGFKVWKDDYDNFKGKYNLNGTMAYGMCFRFAEWLRENTDFYIDESGEEVLNNTSGLRDGNRLDIHSNYWLTEDGKYQISFLWALENGIVYAEVYDSEEDKYVGYIEVCC